MAVIVTLPLGPSARHKVNPSSQQSAFPLSRRSRAHIRSAAVIPLPAVPPAELDPQRTWRTVLGKFRARTFFPESAARDVTLSPGLPHHRRHPLTADEALAGIVLAIMLVGAIVFAIARLI